MDAGGQKGQEEHANGGQLQVEGIATLLLQKNAN
jgi:hypothetical protein